MKAFLYKMTCITNLHVGNEGSSFGIIDNAVEKDVNEYPIVHASGVKGALRSMVSDQTKAERIFGKATKAGEGTGRGQYAFTDAFLFSRPLRVCGENPEFDSIPVVTIESIRELLEMAQAFNCLPVTEPPQIDLTMESFGRNEFLTNVRGIRVEDEPTGFLNDNALETLLAQLGLEKFAIARSINDYALPTIARNHLDPNNPNLWYEEYVPKRSCFYTFILTPDDVVAPDLPLDTLVQMGGHASIGYGFIKMEKWGESK